MKPSRKKSLCKKYVSIERHADGLKKQTEKIAALSYELEQQKTTINIEQQDKIKILAKAVKALEIMIEFCTKPESAFN